MIGPHAFRSYRAFLDDDDRLDDHYLSWLKEESGGRDVVLFKMKYADGTLFPESPVILEAHVGISFSIRSEFQLEKSILFDPSPVEDFTFLNRAVNAGASVKFSDHVAYYVRH